MVRIGIDFGYKFSGIALLDDNNVVSDYRILEHRTDLSDTLTQRRQLRAMRRRNNSKRRRLRDFYALLKGMGLTPVNSRPGETMTLADRMRIGNRLYALAHYRGWDYAELSEHLVILSDDKAPQLPQVVKNIDNFLLLEYRAPARFAPQKSKKKKGESEDNYKRAHQSAKDAVDSKITKEHLRFIELKNPFLGELYRLEKELYDLGKKADKAKTDEQIGHLQEQIALLQDERDNVYREISGGEDHIESVSKDHIEEWLRERLKVVYDGKEPPQSEDIKDIINRAMVELGLETAEELFGAGKIYRPHRNRHRDEMIIELQKLMRLACGEEYGADGVFLEHYRKTMKKCKDAPPRDVFWACWQDDIKRAQARAKEIADQRSAAENRPITPQDVVKRWVKAAEGIVKHEYRKKRFKNRKIGKCPARCDGEKCGNNLPRKSRTDIRRLQCEIELRNMNIVDDAVDGKSRKMTEEEIVKVLRGLHLPKQKLSPDDKAHNRTVVKREIKTPPVKNDARGKKESLGDIVGGEQNGRAALCVVHLREKLRILKEGIDRNIDAWNSMHEERILDLLDAPPSIRQKAERVVREVRKMLRKQPNAEVAHIGLETARFDISALAQAEGKKMKATQYQKSRSPRDKVGLAAEQDNLCFLCGKPLGRNIHVDHLRPRNRGGSNVRLNLVAMHDYCNINKGKYDSPVSEQALAALRRNNSRKGEAVQKALDKSHFLPNLESPQHTMFGAKILKGALMNALNISREIICRPRAADVAFFRRQWFNFMDRQKSAIRAKNWNIEIIAGESTEVDLSEFNLSKHLFGGQTLRVDGGGGLVRLSGDKLHIDTQAIDAGVRGFFIVADNERVELTAHAREDDNAIKLPQKKSVKGEVGKMLQINLRGIYPAEWRDFAPSVHSKWLTLSDDKKTLSGVPVLTEGRNGPYVEWPKVFDGKDKRRRVDLRVQTARRRLSIKIMPPDMKQQKEAFRGKEWDIKITTGVEKDISKFRRKFKLSKYLFGGQTLRVDGGGELVSLADDKLHIDTKTRDTGGALEFFIAADNERVELTAHADDKAIKLPKKNWSAKGEVGKMLQINLCDICPAEWRDFAPSVHSDWLTLSEDKKTLSGSPIWAEGQHTPYVVCKVSFFDDEGKLRGCFDLRAERARRQLSMKIIPKADGIHLFHHALDAAIMAANIDWDEVKRLSSKIDTRDFMERRKMYQQADVGAPCFDNLTVMGNNDWAAPSNEEVYYRHYEKDALQRGKLSTRKYRTEPWRLRDKKLSQRIPLPSTAKANVSLRDKKLSQRIPLSSIAKDNVKNIISPDIRTAMELLWEEINAMGKEEQKQATHEIKNKKCISQNHFLSLSKDPLHPLHPFNVRSARCRRGEKNDNPNLYERIKGEPNKHDRRQNAYHYFRREEEWAKAEVHENDKGEKTVHRVKNPFYWTNKKKPEFDVPPPVGARRVACYRRGDKVRVKGRAGEWKIIELGKESTLQPQCAESYAVKNGGNIDCVYHKLSKC